MKGIASRTAGPDVNEFLNNQKQSRADPWDVAGRYRNVRLLPVSTDQASAASA